MAEMRLPEQRPYQVIGGTAVVVITPDSRPGHIRDCIAMAMADCDVERVLLEGRDG